MRKKEAQSSIKTNYENVSEKYANAPDHDNYPYFIPDINPYADADALVRVNEVSKLCYLKFLIACCKLVKVLKINLLNFW